MTAVYCITSKPHPLTTPTNHPPRDTRETLGELSTEKKNDLQKSENARFVVRVLITLQLLSMLNRLNKYSVSTGGYYSSYSRKERALKIYSEEEQRADESNTD